MAREIRLVKIKDLNMESWRAYPNCFIEKKENDETNQEMLEVETLSIAIYHHKRSGWGTVGLNRDSVNTIRTAPNKKLRRPRGRRKKAFRNEQSSKVRT